MSKAKSRVNPNRPHWRSKRTFIVLDVPFPVAEHISVLRRQYGSWRAALPVEITVAGSSGLGVLRYHESEIEGIFGALDHLGRDFAPIVTRFPRVAMFPDTRVFYYDVSEAAPFVALQNALVRAGLRFERSPFPFAPHCTIADWPVVAAQLPAELESLALPETEIVLDTLSVYTLDERVMSGNPDGCRLLHRTSLGETKSAA